MEPDYYGFDLCKYTENGIGFGALIYDVMLAYHHCRLNNQTLVFVKEGYEARWFDGSKEGEIKVRYHDIFINPFELVSKSLIKDENIWENHYSFTVSRATPDNIDPYVWYSVLMKYVFKLTPKTQEEVEKKIERSGFRNDDILLHIRRTDKIKVREGSWVEAGEMSVDDYIDNTIKIINTSTSIREPQVPVPRVFLCTDDMEIIEYCQNKFKESGIEMVFDPTQDKREIHSLRLARKLDSEDVIDANLTAASIIVMMSRCKYLIGGRMSMLFRVGELLRYPDNTNSLNLKDSDSAGPAQYVRKGEVMVNPLHKIKSYDNFISKSCNADKGYGFTIIEDFINLNLKEIIIESVKSSDGKWWELSEDGYYKMDVSRGQHYMNCNCFACIIYSTMIADEVKDYLSVILESNVVIIDSCFRGYLDARLRLANDISSNNNIIKNNQHLSLVLILSDNKPRFGTLVLVEPDEEYIVTDALIMYTCTVVRY